MYVIIEQLIEVIEEVRDNFRNHKGYSSIRNMRISACHSVEARHGITNQSVIDEFVRRLTPQIQSAAQFDTLLEMWLLWNALELRDIILQHKASKNDALVIHNAFHKADEEDILLSEEFGVDANDLEFKEGKEKLKIHLIKERNRNLVKPAKEEWQKQYSGNIPCSVCLFSFNDKYGKIGEGFIEAHHLVPLSSLTSDIITRISDLAPLCANCHSIIHRYRPWLSIRELKDSLE